MTDHPKLIDEALIKAWEKQLARFGDGDAVFFLGRRKFSKKEILDHLRSGDAIGVKIAEMSHRLTIDLLMRGKMQG